MVVRINWSLQDRLGRLGKVMKAGVDSLSESLAHRLIQVISHVTSSLDQRQGLGRLIRKRIFTTLPALLLVESSVQIPHPHRSP
jgi:hypothetical protein